MARAFKLKPWVYAGLLALSPLAADAAGLGKLTVTSALGQPLRAEIELVSVQKDELSSIAARLASADAFKEASIERSGALMDIKFNVDQKKDGSPVLKLSTVQPLNEPFLDMLIELNWAAGRLLREYTVLLDPPGYAAPQSVAPVAVSTVKSAVTAAPAPRQESSPIPSGKAAEAKPANAPTPATQTAAPEKQNGEIKSYGPVKKGETLNGIASQLKPEGYNLEQMLVALYQNNKNAFSGNNMNRLKAGQILRVPEEQQLASVNRSEASHEVKAHTSDWNAYRQKLAAAVTEAPAPKVEAPRQEAKGKITTAVEDKAALPAPSKDVLKVTKGEAPANAKDMQSLQSKVQSLQEETTAREKSLKEANDRIAALEKNIKEMQQLIELKNKNLADLQKQATAKPEPVAPPPPPPVAATVKPAEPVAKPAEPVTSPVEPPKPVVEKPAQPKPEVKPQAAPGLLDSITGNPLYLAGAVGALALLGGGALIAINRRRRKSLSSFEDSILTGGDLKANTVFGETAGGVVDTGDTSFLTDFSQAGLGTIDTNDVDPIAEAEVYMAYGRDAQAEEILKEAMVKDPNRHEIHLKLLEIYAARKNLIAFETLAGELYAAIGGQSSPLWDKVAEMGRALDPNNPLYGKQEGGRGVAESAAVAAVAAVAVDLAAPTQGLVEEEVEAAAPEEDLTSDLDFGLDEEPAAAAEVEEETHVTEAAPVEMPVAEPGEEEFGALEFDLGSFAEQPAAVSPVAEESTASEVEPEMEFDLGELTSLQTEVQPEVTLPPETETETEANQEIPAEEVGGMELDLDALMAPSEEVPATVSVAHTAEEELNLDFSLALPESEYAENIEAEATPAQEEESIVLESAPVQEEEAHLDFDFDLGEETKVVTPEEKMPAAMPELDLSGISLDMGEPTEVAAASLAPSGEELGDSTEAATKLDLARAYVEMGDTDGAREILEEVLKEGSAQQQGDAKQLLASLDA
ncbi:motility protein FimV [Sulfurimicrobium lacus]|uniref:Motility protein FimV n=1 Tax=Sulfurimicrobium lacus TaxID=2715678 RepID=A0A6F8V9N7_9PROT|nr:FimV/HubP family polar landmark protein [Sulfurimicrobium lacus]BCB26418.1 motility protein FimV [Sulfurimicrobium lacus]